MVQLCPQAHAVLSVNPVSHKLLANMLTLSHEPTKTLRGSSSHYICTLNPTHRHFLTIVCYYTKYLIFLYNRNKYHIKDSPVRIGSRNIT